jgi:hypothetical protein
MIAGVQVGFGNLIGAELLADLRDRAVQAVRSEYFGVQNAHDLGNLIAEVVDAELIPYAALRPGQFAWLPDQFGPLMVECWNEPNIGTPPTPRMTPAEYAAELRMAANLMSPSHQLYGGVISNLTVEALNWLRDSLAAGWPPSAGVAIHWYPPKGKLPPRNQHKGFGSREHEVERLLSVIGDRPWGVSEIGYNDAEGLTRGQVLDATRWERDFWEQRGAQFCLFYQVNDGPSGHYLDHFGWRTYPHPEQPPQWKDVANALRRLV